MTLLSFLCLPAAALFASSPAPASPLVVAPAPATAAAVVQDVADDLNARALEELRDVEEISTLPVEPAAAAPAPLATQPPVAMMPQGVVFADLNDEQVYALAETYINQLKTISARFRQTSPSGSVTMGDLKMERPGKIRFDYDAPSPNLIVATRGMVYLHDAALETTDSYPLNRTPLKFLLGTNTEVDDVQLLGVDRGIDTISVSLQSTERDTVGQLLLDFDAPEIRLRGWSIIDGRGNITNVELSDIVEGENIPNSNFRVPEAGGFGLRRN